MRHFELQLVLIPGAGNAYEAEYLWKQGFKNVFVLDFSNAAMQSFLSRLPDFPKSNILIEDFFKHEEKYDLIIEQTFFTSIFPSQRKEYAAKTAELLKAGGKLTGLFFNHPFNFEGPPYSGTVEEYQALFSPYYKFEIFEDAYNSIKPRIGRELFFVLEKQGV
ncbi:MAG: hypothetical protein PF484_04940 [Bacteroidales bacterium]|jgi:hypothetical protein|nr:hypothetical protein [Bacteroidales bacterium]